MNMTGAHLADVSARMFINHRNIASTARSHEEVDPHGRGGRYHKKETSLVVPRSTFNPPTLPGNPRGIGRMPPICSVRNCGSRIHRLSPQDLLACGPRAHPQFKPQCLSVYSKDSMSAPVDLRCEPIKATTSRFRSSPTMSRDLSLLAAHGL